MLFERTVVYTLLFAFLSWGKLCFRQHSQKLKKFALLSAISLCSAAIFKSTCVHPAHAWQPYCMEFLAMACLNIRILATKKQAVCQNRIARVNLDMRD